MLRVDRPSPQKLVLALTLAGCAPPSPRTAAPEAPFPAVPVVAPSTQAEVQGAALPPARKGELAMVYGGYGAGYHCLGHAQVVFCTRNGEAFGTTDFVNLRIDIRSGESTILGKGSLASANQLLDGGEMYTYHDDALYRLPATGPRMEKVHSLPTFEWEDHVLHRGEVWLRVSTKVNGEDVWRLVGAKLGSNQLLPQRFVPRMEGDGPMMAGAGRLEFVRTSKRTLVRLRLDSDAVSEIPLEGAFETSPAMFLDEKETFILRPHVEGEARGWTLVAVGLDGSKRVVRKEVYAPDSSEWAPYQLVGDGTHLYYNAGRIADDQSARVMALPKTGGDPSVVGTYDDGGWMWVDGDDLFISGGASGSIYRAPLR